MATPTKKEVLNYWNQNPMAYGQGRGGVHGFFEAVDREFRESHSDFGQAANEPLLSNFIPYGELRGKRVLEVGCGLGSLLEQISRSGAVTVGVDLTPNATKFTRQRSKVRALSLAVGQADAEALPFRDGSFDVVVSWGVLHHTPRTEQTIREVFRCLKPGGKAYIMLYHRASFIFLRQVAVEFFKTGRLYESKLYRADAHDPEGRGAPISRAYTRSEIRRMFRPFREVVVKVDGQLRDVDDFPVARLGGLRFISHEKKKRLVTRYGAFLLIEAKK